MKKLFFLLTLWLIISAILTEDDESKFEQVFIGTKKTFKLQGQKPFAGHYQITMKQSDLPRGQDKWYFFAMAQPRESQTQYFGQPSKIQIKKIVGGSGAPQLIRTCTVLQQFQACFINNAQFNYKTDKIRVNVHCDESCAFELVTQIDYAYPLKMNTPFKMNFENTAYSKIFSLNTETVQFDQLRIILSPRGFIKYGQPITLLANFGDAVPTTEKHDFKGIHIWHDGQGIFIRKSELKQKKLTILVQGPERNVLNLIAQGWMKQQRIKLNQYWPQVDLLKASQSRQFVFDINQTNLTHRVKIVTFSGALQLTKIYKMEEGISQRLSVLDFAMPAQKYGQYEFRISKQLIKSQNIKKVVLKVSAKKETTYLINYARQQDAISTILPYVSQSSLMQPNQTDQYYLKIQQLIQSAKEKKSSNIEIILGNIVGDVRSRFFKCNFAAKLGTDNSKNCQYKQSNKGDFSQIFPFKVQNRATQKRYWFEIEWGEYMKKTDKDTAQIVFQMTAIVQNANQGNTSSYQIQYKNKDRIYLLKEGELVKDRVFMQEKRHYKLSIQDSDATQIKVHCTKISGDAFFLGSFTDPRTKKQYQKILPVHGVISFKIGQGQSVKEVFVQVQGVQSALYSLTTQVIRKSQSNPSKKNGTGYNQLIVRQEIPYEFLISPQDSIVLQLHTSSKEIHLNLKSTQAVKVCMTQNLEAPPFFPNCQIRNDSFLQFNEKVFMDRGLVGNIGIKNINDKNVTIKIYISKTKGQCQIAPMNEIMFKKIGLNGKDSEGSQNHCVEFNLNKIQQLQLVVQLKMEYQYNEGSITASINDQEVIKMTSPSYKFTKQVVQLACAADKKSGNTDNFCYLRVRIQGVSNTKVRVLAQYTDSVVKLIDGISHPVTSLMKKTQPKYFIYGVHNVQNITILLQNKLGQYKLYSNLMKYQDYANTLLGQNKTIAFPTPQKKDFSSSNPFYYLQQIITIPKDKIKQKCQSKDEAIDCVLLLAVYLDRGDAQVLKNGKFVIAATQHNRQLLQNVPVTGFLQKKSIAFYYFENPVKDGTIIVTVNNQNKNCLDIYLREGSEKASASSYDGHAKSSNTLIFNSSKVMTYSITLQAKENCPFTISVSSNKNNIAKIKKGIFVDINLKKGEEKNLLFENLINETFKVLSLQKQGQVIISVMPVPRTQLERVLNGNISRLNDWVWSNKDSVRINNWDIRKNASNPKYCVDCFYLININAQRPTQASVIIPTPDSQLPIQLDSLIKDLLLTQEKSIYRIFTDTKSQFEIYVQYGRVRVTIIQTGEKESVVFNKTFQSSKGPVLQTFTLSKTQTYQFLRYSKIVIQALEDSYFSFATVSNTDPNKRGPSVKYGIPQYLFLQGGKQKCLTGSMAVNSDNFLFSFPKSDKKNIQNLQVTLKVNKKSVSIDKQLGASEMLLRINSIGLIGDNAKYDLCMKSKQPIAVTVIQSSPVNYWPQKQSILVKNDISMTFGSEGRNIIQINECKSRASVQINSQFNDLKTTSSQVKQRRRNNNIFEFYHYGPVYIKIKAERASIKWFSINETDNSGMGYEEYQSGWVRTLKQGNQLQITAQPISPIDTSKKTSSKLQTITYSFYAAKQQMEIYNAMNCWQGQFAIKSVIVNLTSNPSQQKSNVRATFDISTDLKPKFSKYSYFLVGVKAEVNVKNQNGNLQTYRFYYPYQQVNKQTLQASSSTTGPDVKPIDPENQQQSSWLDYIGYTLLLLVVLAVSYYVYSKCAKRCVQKKHRLNQSGGMQMKYSDLTQH